jgi:hypothetical protein
MLIYCSRPISVFQRFSVSAFAPGLADFSFLLSQFLLFPPPPSDFSVSAFQRFPKRLIPSLNVTPNPPIMGAMSFVA